MLAVKLSATQPDYLVWLRKEQLQSYTWAGDPTKPIIDNDPLKLSPRRSFAAWSEIVRGTSAPWTPGELALASAFGDALIDIIVQVHAVRLLIAEHQLNHVRDMVADSKEPVVVAAAAAAPSTPMPPSSSWRGASRTSAARSTSWWRCSTTRPRRAR